MVARDADVEVGDSALNESPSEKEGKLLFSCGFLIQEGPSMKVPPKRKGNAANPAGTDSQISPQ